MQRSCDLNAAYPQSRQGHRRAADDRNSRLWRPIRQSAHVDDCPTLSRSLLLTARVSEVKLTPICRPADRPVPHLRLPGILRDQHHKVLTKPFGEQGILVFGRSSPRVNAVHQKTPQVCWSTHSRRLGSSSLLVGSRMAASWPTYIIGVKQSEWAHALDSHCRNEGMTHPTFD
jgi:hypothetical protein